MLFQKKPLTVAILSALSMSAHAADGKEAGSVADSSSKTAAATLGKIKVSADAASTGDATTQIGKLTQTLRDLPQSITVIDRTVLDAQGATTLTDALRNVPGITLSAGEGGVIGDNINLRGFSARTDLYVDGMRDRGQYSRDTFFLESVEVLKGPSSMLFGRGSTGGVINQVSKLPRREAAGEVAASIGGNDYYRMTADYNQPLGEQAAVRVSAFGHSSESSRDVAESERYGVAPSLRFGIGEPTEVTLSAVVQRRDDIPDYGFPFTPDGTRDNPAKPIDVDRDHYFGYTDDSFEQRTELVGARITHAFSPALTLRNQTQYSSARIVAEPTRINVTAASYASGVGTRQRLARDIDDRSLYNQTDLIAKLGQGGVQHTLIAGVEIGRDDYENQNYTTNIPAADAQQSLSSPVYRRLPAGTVVTDNTFTDNVGKTLAVYANEQLELGEHWKLIGGVRWDEYEFDTRVEDNTGAVTADFSQTDRMTSVRGGVVYQPDKIQTYYVSYGTSFNPSAETLTISAANQNVDPEKNRSYEVGAKWSFDEGRLLLTSALFRIEKTNARSRDAVLNIVSLDGETRVEGFELGLSGNITDNWQALAGYTYLDGEIVDLTESSTSGNVTTVDIRDGNVLPNTPKHSASLWTTYDLPLGWQVGGGLVHTSKRIVNNANTALVEGYTRFDATVAYTAQRYAVRLNLQNLTNEEYFEVASGGRATPAARRTALATVTWTF